MIRELQDRLFRPEFVYRPSQLFRAARQKWKGDPTDPVVCRLPWGGLLTVDSSDYIGHQVYRHGLTAFEACETAFRILLPGDRAIDGGANLGTVTSAMSTRVGKSGHVISIEMLPATFSKLANNVAAWGKLADSVELVNSALSDRAGMIQVGLSDDFSRNSGVAYATHQSIPEDHSALTVPCIRLDNLVDGSRPIQLLKLDVERHEFPALVGAGRLISDHIIRNIIFEDCTNLDTPAKQWLEAAGYRIYSISAKWRKPFIEPWRIPDDPDPMDSGHYSDFLATTDPERLERIFSTPGYRCLA